MASRLKPHEPVSAGIPRIARREIAHALSLLDDPQRDEDKTVHDLRTHCKKIRALLRLARAGLGDRAYHRENNYFRDAAHPLTEVRDAKVLVKTLDGLTRYSFPSIRKALQDNYLDTRRRVLEREHALEVVGSMLEDSRLRAPGWPIREERKSLQRGLRRVYRQGYQACACALRQPTTPHLHEWRKQAKYLWYQLKMLESLQSKRIKKLVKQYRRLTELLGDDHDLATLGDTVAGLGDAQAPKLMPLIDRKRERLQRRALKLGKQLYKRKPSAFVQRVAP